MFIGSQADSTLCFKPRMPEAKPSGPWHSLGVNMKWSCLSGLQKKVCHPFVLRTKTNRSHRILHSCRQPTSDLSEAVLQNINKKKA